MIALSFKLTGIRTIEPAMIHLVKLPSYLSRLIPIYVALLLLCSFSSYGKSRFGNETDQRALLAFKAKINDSRTGVLNSWNDSVHFCQWHGVTCGHLHQRVTVLELNSSKLEGSISAHVGNLSFLRVLNLEDNSFSGEIPQEIWRLGRLQQLRLANNSIAGLISANVSGCSKLRVLDLSGNMLAGEMPRALGNWFPRLQNLVLGSNKLTGRIPASLGNLSSLEVLVLARNSLTGDLPESLGQLRKLTHFSVGENRFSGVIPSSIFNLSDIRTCDVLSNQIQGSLPAEMGITMPYLEVFQIFENQFTGGVPLSISNATNLVRLALGKNRLTGDLPCLQKLDRLEMFSAASNHLENDLNCLCSLVNASALRTLALGLNNFEGEIPKCVGNLSTHLRVLALEANKLSGKIPTAIGNLINLEWFSLYGNRLSGLIPSFIGSLAKLQELYLDENEFSGGIPPSFGDLEMLTRLTINENHLQGGIPPSLGKCKRLIVLDVSRNNLSGSISPQIFNLSSLSMALVLAANRFTGSIPSEVGNLNNLGFLDISQNLLSGEITSSFGSCESLLYLDLSGNSFQGTIPSSFSSLGSLQILNMSNNRLTGEIPKFFASFRFLIVLNLSHNEFEGMVPSTGPFSNTSVFFAEGNDKLCGGIPQLQLPKCSFHGSNRKKFLSSWRRTLFIFSLLLGAALLVSIVLCFRFRKKRKASTSGDVGHQFAELSYHSLFKATDGFSKANLIGAGSFGSVYRGVLDEGRTLVAIKVFNWGASKSFIAECKALRNIRHRNLVKVLTACSSIDHQGNDFKALVYELMSNGSLEEWLHHDTELNDSTQRKRTLNLLQRLSIAIDMACALEYLHHHCETTIVHCDLKPSNVLLDDDMTAHLGDFGLVRFLPRVADNETSSIGVRGSIGYTAPEYGMGSEVSSSGDVYSYGVLLLEMFTGKRPTNEIFQDGLDLHKFGERSLPDGVLEIIDPTLVCENQQQAGIDVTGNRNSRKFQELEECLISVIGIGVACSAQLPT